MGPIGKDKLVFDTTATLSDNDNVGAFVTASDGTLVTHHTISAGQYLDVYSAMADGSGTALTSTLVSGKQALDVNITNGINVDVNGIYNVITNPLPANVGLIGSSRAAPGLANQTLQFTGGALAQTALSGSNIVAQDVNSFGMIYNGATYDAMTGTGGNLNVNIAAGTVAVTQSTSPWVVSNSGTFAVQAAQSGTWTVGLSEDHNYGTVGANTLRTAAQIGNATGAAAFGAGTTSAQTLRVVLPTDQTAIPVIQSTTPWNVIESAPNTAFNTTNVTVDNTVGGTALFAAPLAARKQVLVQNLGNQPIYLGSTGVTTATGIRIAAGANWEIDAGPAQNLFAIGNSATAQDIRVFQIS